MSPAHPLGHVHLGKYHGLGNDFLVWLTDAATASAADLPRLARHACNRRRGVGADGLLVAVPARPAGDLRMFLYNSDGSRAEMSGNGIRCLVHAAARDAGMEEGELRVLTDAGLRTVAFTPADGNRPDPCAIVATVEMGAAAPGPDAEEGVPEPAEPVPLRRATVSLGNPHLVLLVDDPAKVDVAQAGPAFEACYSSGINVHFVAPADEGAGLVVRTWERGAGPTEACGTGAAAAAHTARSWGLVGDDVMVHMPGGDVQVLLDGTITLTGPSVWVADADLPWPGEDL